MKTILILALLAIGIISYKIYDNRRTPRIGQVYIRNIETSYGYPRHVDTILILNVDETDVTFTRLNVYDEWFCPITTIKRYGTVLK